MATVDYTRFANTATRLLERFGQTAVLRKHSDQFTGCGRDRRPSGFTRHSVIVADKGIVSETMPGRDGASVVERSRQLVMGVLDPTSFQYTNERYTTWGSPEVMAEQTVANREAFIPPNASLGVQATNLGIFAWFVGRVGDPQEHTYLLFQPNDDEAAFVRKRQSASVTWGAFTDAVGTAHEVSNENANRSRSATQWPNPQFIYIDPSGNDSPAYNLPPIEFSDQSGLGRYGILVDDAAGQSLYYCNSLVGRCEHYRRAFTADRIADPAPVPENRDVVEMASGEQLTIVDVDTASPSGTNIVHKLKVEA